MVSTYLFEQIYYFHLHPSFNKLGKYYTLPETLRGTGNGDKYCFLVHIDQWQSAKIIEEKSYQLHKIFAEHELIEVQHDLMYLFLMKLREIDETISFLEEDCKHKSRIKELLMFLAVLEGNTSINKTRLSVSTFAAKTEVRDKDVLQWINNSLSDAVVSLKIPTNTFGLELKDLYFNESTKRYSVAGSQLNTYIAKLNVTQTRKELSRLKADLCLETYMYLINETDIKQNPKAIFSDKLLRFYFDILQVFGYVHIDEIKSNPKDFMRTLLQNRIKQLNHSLSKK